MKTHFLTLLLLLFLVSNIKAQEGQATKIVDNNTFSLQSSNLGALQNSVNMFTGDVNFPLTLMSAPGANGMGISVSASYNSNVQHLANRINEESPTSTLGLGWSLDMPQIMLDHKNTGVKDDDEYYLVEGGASNQLFFTGTETYFSEDLGNNYASTEIFKPKNYVNWKIRYIRTLERWEITREDGTVYIYGDESNHSTAVQYVVKWGNWIGNSSVTLDQSQMAFIWNVSKTVNWNDDWAVFTYLKAENKVGGYFGKHQTEASYLNSIENKLGYTIKLYYNTKSTLEFFEPHIEDPTEPDAYQERYESKFLTGLTLSKNQTIINSTTLNYHSIFKLPARKRLLESISTSDKYGVFHKNQTFDYYESGTRTGALKTVTSATGSVATFNYNTTGVSLSNAILEKTFSINSGSYTYAEPKVYQGPGYTVVAWRQLTGTSHAQHNKRVKVYVYWWDGTWKEQFITDIYPVDISSLESNSVFTRFRVSTQKNFFAVAHSVDGQNYCDLFLASKDPATDGWGLHESVINIGDNSPALVTGTNFAAVGRSDRSKFKVYKKNSSDSWISEEIDAGWPSSAGHYTAANNYIWTGIDNGDNIMTYLYYFDRERELQTRKQSQFSSNSDYFYYASPSNSFVLSAINNGNAYIHHWDENYTLTNTFLYSGLSSISSTTGSRGQTTNNSLVSFSDYFNDKIFLARFNGSTWKKYSELTDNHVERFALGEDYAIWSDNYLGYDGYRKEFDPNTDSWKANEQLPEHDNDGQTVGAFWSGYSYYWPYIHKRDRDGVWNNTFYTTDISNTDGSSSYVYGSPSFFVHGKSSGSGVHSYIIQDGDAEEDENIDNSSYTGLYATQSGGLNTLVTYNASSVWNSTQLKLRKIVDTQASGSIKDYPVTTISINNGVQTSYTAFKFETTDAIFDPSGHVANYHTSSIRPGSTSSSSMPYGKTESYFYNGFFSDNSRLSYIDSRSSLLRGTNYETIAFNSLGDELTSTETNLRLNTNPSIRNSNNDYLEDSYAILPDQTTQTIDGVATSTYYTYNTINQLTKKEVRGYNSKGILEKMQDYYSYYWEEYDTDRSENLISPIIETAAEVAILGTSYEKALSVTTWKNINGKNRPYRTYQKYKSGTQNFTDWNNVGSVSSKWRLTSELTYDLDNNVIQIKDALGNYSSNYRAEYDSTLPILNVRNSTYDKIWAENFDDEQIIWSSSGNWSASNGVALHTNTSGIGTLTTDISSIGNPFNGDYILELDVRLEANTNNGNVSIIFDKPSSGDGYEVVIHHNGLVELYDNGTFLTSDYTEEILEKWQPFRMVNESATLHVYIGNEKVLSHTVDAKSGTDIELAASNIKAAFDNIRVYPSDAYASSSSYDLLYGFVKQAKKESGSTNYFSTDEYNIGYASSNHDMSPNGSEAFYNSYEIDGSFNNSIMNTALSTAARGTNGFTENFDVNLGQWQEVSSGNGSSSTWEWEGGNLLHTTTGTSGQSGIGEKYILDLPQNISGDRVAVEILVKTDDNFAVKSFGWGVGADTWNGAEGTGAFWSYFTTGNDIVVNGSNIDLNLPTGLTYKLLAILDFNSNTTDFYANGKLIAHGTPFQNTSIDEVGKIVLFNYGSSDANTVFRIDNLLIYSNPLLSAESLDASGGTRQVQSELPSNKVMVSESFYDALNRPYIQTRAMQQTGKLGFKSSFAGWNSGAMLLSQNIASTTTGYGTLAYSGTLFDNSPLRRAIATKAPGNDFSLSNMSHVSSIEYHNNGDSGYDISEDLAAMGFMDDLQNGNYTVTKSTNPDGAESWVMTDNMGNTFLTKTGTVKGIELIPNYSEIQHTIQASDPPFVFTAYHDHNLIFTGFGTNLTILKNGEFLSSNSPSGGSPGTISGNFTVEAGNSYKFTFTGQSGHSMLIIYQPWTIIEDGDIYLYSRNEFNHSTNTATSDPPEFFNPSLPETERLNFRSTTVYNYEGSVTSVTAPDAGLVEYKYDRYGRLRFQQDAEGSSNGYFSYWKYNDLGRITEEGYITSSFTTANPDTDTWPTTPTTWRKKYNYGRHENTTYDHSAVISVEVNNDTDNTTEVVEEYITMGGDAHTVSTRMHLPGESVVLPPVSTTSDNLGNTIKIEYKIPEESLDAKVITGTKSLSGVDNIYLSNVTIESSGSLTAIAGETITMTNGFWAKEGATLVASVNATAVDNEEIQYQYDLAGRLIKIGNDTDDDKYATYTYDKNGAIDGEQLGTSYLVDHEYYDDNGAVKSLEQSNLSFKETYTYNSGQYGGYYSGLIANKEIKYGSAVSDTYTVDYKYDKLARLKVANNSNDDFDEGVSTSEIKYDMNGNILFRKSKGISYSYNYTNGTNKITSITGHGSFSYDAKGNTIAAPNLPTLTYDKHINLTTRITNDTGDDTRFKYGASDQRIEKEDEEGANTYHTWYMFGASTQPSLQVKEEVGGGTKTVKYIYGAKGLIAYKSGSTTYHTVTDFQGSVRHVSNGDRYHYMPFGTNIGLYATISGDVDYGFQGQEPDEETGLYNYKSRLYDPIAGRFYAMDPAGQFASTYTGIGNNPVNFTDPSGEVAIVPIIGAAVFWGVVYADKEWRDGGDSQDIALAGGKAAGISVLSSFIGQWTQVAGAIPNALIQSGVSVGVNGISNTASGDPFFDNYKRAFASGLVSGAIQGDALAKSKGRNPMTGGKLRFKSRAHNNHISRQMEQIINSNSYLATGGGNDYYTIKAGDTYYNIGKRFGVSPQQLQEWNDIDPRHLPIGKIIVLKPPLIVGGEPYTTQIGNPRINYSKAWNYGFDQTLRQVPPAIDATFGIIGTYFGFTGFPPNIIVPDGFFHQGGFQY